MCPGADRGEYHTTNSSHSHARPFPHELCSSPGPASSSHYIYSPFSCFRIVPFIVLMFLFPLLLHLLPACGYCPFSSTSSYVLRILSSSFPLLCLLLLLLIFMILGIGTPVRACALPFEGEAGEAVAVAG